jgi:hypothetical protein
MLFQHKMIGTEIRPVIESNQYEGLPITSRYSISPVKSEVLTKPDVVLSSNGQVEDDNRYTHGKCPSWFNSLR